MKKCVYWGRVARWGEVWEGGRWRGGWKGARTVFLLQIKMRV